MAQVVLTKDTIRTKDYTVPKMRFVAAESIARDKILVTLQVDEGAMVWCAAWSADPAFTDSTDAETERGERRGGLGRADYDDLYKWKPREDVDIVVSGLTEETDYPFIYCFAQDDETVPNKMFFDSAGSSGDNVHTMQQEIGTVKTLDESPPIFTMLSIADPTALNDRIVVTFQLNEAWKRRRVSACRSEGRARREEILDPLTTGTITITSLESRDPTSVIYEASQYDIYCWAKDSAVDTHGFARPNYMSQSYVETPVGSVASPAGGDGSTIGRECGRRLVLRE
eukprot:g25611.t1